MWAPTALGSLPCLLALPKNLMFALLGKAFVIDEFIVNDLIGEEESHRIAVRMFNTELNGVTLTIGFWQVHIENYRDCLALVGACHFLK